MYTSTWTVRLENRGGFLQAALDLKGEASGAFSNYEGVLLDVYGNGESYNVHLRTAAARLPWQSYRATFQAPARWQTLRLPFSRFEPYRIDMPLDVRDDAISRRIRDLTGWGRSSLSFSFLIVSAKRVIPVFLPPNPRTDR